MPKFWLIEVINVVTRVIQGSHMVATSLNRGCQSVLTTSHQGHQSGFTIGLQGHQNVTTMGCQSHTKVMKGSHMSQKLPNSSLVTSLACQKLPRDKVACLTGNDLLDSG
jgi:hypothetical protein